ncbi:substrate-binding domain-containing protein [Gordonia hydrophobica]|uniref:Extracellular solute-binding protein n=1 Tax=Gordonia hydrophobica TaxID=40516 RepID=A0ABZ2TZ72_9ACTN|nr:substrate-binding domain-containing protein [Gordonia hydrophobica]MBM7368942.1 ABC-type phosphate transport system substrate-binding protein [Gordonia hydrophobica]
MARHNSGERSRNFVSRPLIAVALVLILIAGAVTAWRQLGDEIDDQPATANPCLEGQATVSVLADPAVAPGLQKIAENFNKTSPTVRDHCITVVVRPADARATLEGLTAKTWDDQTYGAFPAAWVPQSSVWAASLQVSNAAVLQGNPESLVSSPVRLAMEPELAKAVDGDLSWSDLPAQTRPNSLAAFGERSWGSMRIAMPDGPQSDATALMTQAVAAATVPTEKSLTTRQVQSDSVVSAIDELLSAPPKVGNGSIDAVVRAIAETTDPADAPVRAVAVTEQQLYALTKDDAKARVADVTPKGRTPIADYPVIRLAGPAVPAHTSDAVAEFFTFARKPAQMEILTMSGFHGSGKLPDSTPTVTFGEVTDPLPLPEPAASVAISKKVFPAAAG